MVNSKSIVTYKIRYDPDKKKKCKTVQVEENGTTNFFRIPIVSGEKGVEFHINEQTKPFFELSTALNYTGEQKFEKYGDYLSGPIKTMWELVLADEFPRPGQRTNPGFKRALIALWKRYHSQQDLREACIKMIFKLEWKKVYKKHGHGPAKYTQRVETLYTLIQKLDTDPGTTPMPTTRQRNKELVESFPREYRLYFDLRGGDFNGPMNQVGRIMAEKFDRDKDSDSDTSSLSSGDDDSLDSIENTSGDESLSSSSVDSSSKKRKSKKRKRSKKELKKQKKDRRRRSAERKQARTQRRSETRRTLAASDICPIHGGHKWGDCRLNLRSPNYDPPVKRNQNSQHGYTGNSQNDRTRGQPYQVRSQGRSGQDQGRSFQQNQYHFASANEDPWQQNDAEKQSYALGKFGVPNGTGGIRAPRVGETSYSAYRRACTQGF